ncbi:MAG: Smr/MutS family protein [Nitrospirota bacterium]|jgi:DNA-nicking Smr family endonuclease
MSDVPTPDDDLARQDREFLAAMAGGGLSAESTSRLEGAAAEEAERDREEFLAYLAAHAPPTTDGATPGPRGVRRRTGSLHELRRRALDAAWMPDAQIDLHGRTRDAARAALERFTAWSLDEGLANVLVVVGQGHHSPGGDAVVARVVREWLNERGLESLAAPPRLGGGGALLVSLSQSER